MGRTRHETCGSMCKALFTKAWSRNRQGSDNTGTSQVRQIIFLGLAWVYDRRTKPRGLDMRGNPNNTSNSPGEVQTQSETAGKGLIQDIQAEDQEQDNKAKRND